MSTKVELKISSPSEDLNQTWAFDTIEAQGEETLQFISEEKTTLFFPDDRLFDQHEDERVFDLLPKPKLPSTNPDDSNYSYELTLKLKSAGSENKAKTHIIPFAAFHVSPRTQIEDVEMRAKMIIKRSL